MRNKSGVILAVIGFLVLCYGEGWGTDWKGFSVDEDYISFYDRHNIKKISSGILRVWQKMVPSDKTVEENVKEYGLQFENWAYSLCLTEVNCLEGKMRWLSITSYDKSGKVIVTREFSDAPWRFITPESKGETLLKIICPKGQDR
jgi:hypothetical protein